MQKAIMGKDKMLAKWTKDRHNDMDEKTLSAIHLCWSYRVLRKVLSDKTTTALWNKLESLYMAKSLINKLHPKHSLYTLWMAIGISIRFHLILMVCIYGLLMLKLKRKMRLFCCCVPFQPYINILRKLLYGKDIILVEDIKLTLLFKRKTNNYVTSSVRDVSSDAFAIWDRTRNKDF